ncbi:MAG: hypothetical protein JWM78_3141 [Verrucomicrobiaceae bacterium]|nr:hypothetical protein [Verrucomicrobiaceae bacterium]
MQTNYILIDFENVHVKSLALLDVEQFNVRVFLGPKNTRIPTDLVLAMKALGERADYIVLSAGGHNALDFHITYYLGKLAAADPTANFYIISKDTGFDSLIDHIKNSGINCQRVVSIETLPGMAQLPGIDTTSAKKTPAKKKSASKKKTLALIDLVLANLAKRKGALPRTEKTLRSTIKQISAALHSDDELAAAFDHLVASAYIRIDGTKISYQLPAAT